MEDTATLLVASCMKIGDLVRWVPSLPIELGEEPSYGIVTEIINSYLVGVLWAGSDFIYMESIGNLEVVNADR